MLIHLVVAAMLGAGVAVDYIVYRRLNRIEAKLGVVWGFIYRRAMIEALKRGFLVMNSPIKVRDDLENAYCDIAPGLAKLYTELKAANIVEPDIALEIERRYYEWIIENVCEPFDMDRGECLVIAVEIAKAELAKSHQ